MTQFSFTTPDKFKKRDTQSPPAPEDHGGAGADTEGTVIPQADTAAPDTAGIGTSAVAPADEVAPPPAEEAPSSEVTPEERSLLTAYAVAASMLNAVRQVRARAGSVLDVRNEVALLDDSYSIRIMTSDLLGTSLFIGSYADKADDVMKTVMFSAFGIMPDMPGDVLSKFSMNVRASLRELMPGDSSMAIK